MSTGIQILETLRSLGVTVTVIGADRDRLWLEPADKIPADMVPRIKAEKPAILEALREQAEPAVRPAEPTYAWPSTAVTRPPFEITKDEFIKDGPVRLSNHEVVVDTFKFAMSTLGQLRKLLDNPKAKVGWTAPQLLERLKAVGLTVVVTGPTVTVSEEFVKSIPVSDTKQ